TAASAAMAEGLELASQRALLALEGLSVLSPLQVEANLRLDLPPASPSGEVPEFPRPGPRQLAARLGVEDIVAGRVSCDGLICSIVIERSASDGFLLFSERVEAPLDEPLALEAVMVGAIARAFPERRWRRGAKPAIEVSSADYRSLLDLRRSFEQGDAKADGGAALLEELATLMTRAPNFVDAPLLAARVARHRFFDSRLSQHMSQARALAERARQLSPADPRPLVELIDVESELGNVREARALLAELDAMQPGRVDVAIRRSVLLELEGKPQEALAAVRAIARSRPSTDSLRELGSLELRLGEIDAARATLLELLEGNPDSYAGQALLAELELTHGQADRASQLWETLAERSPSFANLSNWALANMLQGRYRDAEARLERAVELAPQSASAWINLADARQLAGRSGEAASLYARALQLAEEDPEPDSWRQLIVRAQALARLRRPGEAIETLQGALQKAPDNPEVAYVAALVHALLGEMASSEAQTRRALRLGVGERWFFFPAFAPLRSGDGPLPAAAPEVRGPEGFSLPREAD
ncbi:MAG: tetratricopeptide repeat protein, partial [Acidobacteriota bacterium]